MKSNGIFKKFGLAMLLSGLAGGVVYRAMVSKHQGPSASDKEYAAKDLQAFKGTERIEVPSGNYIAGNGIIEPADREIKIQGSISGRIAEILVKEGDLVKRNQILVRLDNSRQKAVLLCAEADISVAKAELRRSLKGMRQEDVEAVLADAEAAQARAQQSQTTYNRLNALASSGGISIEEIDRARQQAQADKANFESAQARKRAALSGSRREDIDIAIAKEKVATAGRAKALADLAETELLSPSVGQILQIKSRVGEYASPGNSDLLIMGDTRTLRARIDVDERDISKLVPGAKGFVTLSAFPGKHFPAHLVEIGKRMGRKNVRTDDPVERLDVKILEAVLELEDRSTLVPGVRIIGYIEADNGAAAGAEKGGAK